MSFKLTIGKISRLAIPAFHNEAIISIYPHLPEMDTYIFKVLPQFSRKGNLKDAIKGATLNRESIANIFIPIPPLAEQHRIVAKVDELMTLCDQLEAAKAAREQRRNQLVAASLQRLNQPADDEAVFREDVRFAFNHLPRLTVQPEHIKQLRQTILNLAVRGRLVPQDPNDELAVELLKRIQAEKDKLVKAGEIPKCKEIERISLNDLSFSIPTNWHPVKLSSILNELQTGPFGSSLHQSDYELNGIPVINPASIQDGQIIPIAKMAVGQITFERLTSFKIRIGDIVMARRGEMGRCAVVTDIEDGWLCGTGSLVLRPSQFILARFLVLLIGSPYGRDYLSGTAVGSTMQNLNQSILLGFPFGLPPLAEQHRIVAKVDELMALCDQLEANLTTTETDSRRLLEAVLHDTLSSPLKEAA